MRKPSYYWVVRDLRTGMLEMHPGYSFERERQGRRARRILNRGLLVAAGVFGATFLLSHLLFHAILGVI